MKSKKNSLLTLIDFASVDTLLEGFNKTTGFVTAILDLDGNVLSKSGWRQICTDFHRMNPESAKRCTNSDTVLAGKMAEGEKYHFYTCLNGLIDVAVPIVINGEHIANLFSGQFFFEEPDRDFFIKQANALGYDQHEYLKALEKVPVVSIEKTLVAMDFLLKMTQLISKMTFQKLEQVELNKNILESENRFKKAFQSSPVALTITSKKSKKFIEVNETWCSLFGYTTEETIGHTPIELALMDSETHQVILDQFKIHGTVKNFDLLLKNKSGDVLNCLFSSESIELGGESCEINTMIDMSDRIRVEEKFKSVFESANVGKSITLPTGEIHVNQTFCDMLGYPKEALRNKKWQDITPAEEIPAINNHLEPLLKGEKSSTRFEKRYICKNGSHIWADVSVSLHLDLLGEPLYFITTIIDITQRKQMENALRESNEKLKKVLETETVGVMFWDLTTGLMMDANDTFLKMMGYSHENVEARELTWQKLTPPEYHAISLAEISKFQETGRVGPYEKEYLCKDGTRKWLVFTGSALGANTCVEFCVDISDRKISESALRLERDFSEAVIDSLPGVFYCFDENLKFKRWNKNFSLFTGYDNYEILRMSPLDFFTGSEKALVADRVQEVFSKGFSDVEANFVAKDGTSTPYYFTGVNTVIDGKTHLVGVGIDISERIRADKALKESEERFSTLFEKSALGAVLSRLPNGVIVDVNGAFEKTFGFSKEEAIGKTTLELGINPDANERNRILAELQEVGSVGNFELILRVKSGEQRIFLINNDLFEIAGEKFILNTLQDITDRKQAEEKQAQSFNLLTNLANLVPGVIYQYELYPDGRSAFPYSSAGMYPIYEVTPEQVQADATPVFGRLHPDDAQRVSDLIFESARTLEEFYCEFRVILPEQGLRWRWSQAHPERTAEGGTLWHGIILDVTERKQKEKELQESEERFRRAIMSAPIPIMIHANDGEVIIVNSPWSNLTGYRHKDIPTIAEWTRLVYGNDMDLVRNDIEKLHKLEGPKAEGEYKITTKSGEQRIWNFNSAPIGKLTDGRSIVISMALDVTERNKLETERMKFYALAESSSEFIAMCDLELNPTYVNPSGQQLVGLPNLTAACQIKVQDYFFPEDQDFIENDFFPRVLRDGHGDVEIRLRHFTTGKPIWMYYYLFRVQDANGQFIGWATVSRDITERRNLIEALENLNTELEQKVLTRTAELEASNRELEAFTYSVSHDLRSPLRHITGYVNLLNNQFQEGLPDKAAHYLSVITDSTEKMGELIDDLLLFSKTSKQDLRLTDVDMEAIVKEVLDGLKEQIKNRKIIWVISKLPHVYGDYALLKQVWVNLLDKAVKYTKYKVEAEIEIGCKQESDHWSFFVRDNGAGFDMKYSQKLFGVFQRLHASSQFEGTGIGLANVQRIIQRHGGSVLASAELDEGATFTFRLPHSKLRKGDQS